MGEKKREKKIPNAVCEECFAIGNVIRIKIYGDTLPIQNKSGQIANKKYMGTLCQKKIYGDRLPIKNTWGQIVNKKYMGTDCK